MRRLLVVLGVVVAALLAVALTFSAGSTGAGPRRGDVVISPDFGFRVESVTNGHVYGSFVVRVGSEWVDATWPPRPSVIPAQP